ncbi:MAG: DNA-formamidopyrimidine glycosylase family protein [Phycisphaerae bacterium]
MPELPDVEKFKRYLDATSLGREIAEVSVSDRRLLDGVSPGRLRRTLEGRRFAGTRRHGKWLLVRLEPEAKDGWLALHFGMTGTLFHEKDAGQVPEYTRVLVRFAGSRRLAVVSMRMLGRVDLARTPDRFVRRRDLGPDALRAGWDTFRDRLGGRTGMVKTTLMNQSVLAGIGNISADEIQFHARVHPRARLDHVGGDRLRRLYEAAQASLAVLVRCIAGGEEVPDAFLSRHRDEGETCPRCGGEVRRIVLNQRGTYYCPRCQRV